ncbi:MAG: DUF1848 family protein [Desulfotomaculales bacterium]
MLSLSRRTDPAWYTDHFLSLLNTWYPPARVHTLVIWTKLPHVFLQRRWRSVLGAYDQVYFHVTVTGLGGTDLEPGVPPPEVVWKELPALVELAGHPARVRLRPDPLVKVARRGAVITNVGDAQAIVRAGAGIGLSHFSTSFMAHYPRVVRRLLRAGFEPLDFGPEERAGAVARLRAAAGPGAKVDLCCVPGFPVSRCIDGELLAELHPRGERCRSDKAAGQREHCGCTHSLDLGWYGLSCPSGCLYCYANPRAGGNPALRSLRGVAPAPAGQQEAGAGP